MNGHTATELSRIHTHLHSLIGSPHWNVLFSLKPIKTNLKNAPLSLKGNLPWTLGLCLRMLYYPFKSLFKLEKYIAVKHWRCLSLEKERDEDIEKDIILTNNPQKVWNALSAVVWTLSEAHLLICMYGVIHPSEVSTACSCQHIPPYLLSTKTEIRRPQSWRVSKQTLDLYQCRKLNVFQTLRIYEKV